MPSDQHGTVVVHSLSSSRQRREAQRARCCCTGASGRPSFRTGTGIGRVQRIQVIVRCSETGIGEGDDDESCLEIDGCLCPSCRATRTPSPRDKKPPRQSLRQLVLPGDCDSGGIAFGGFVMKLMDNAAGCCAAKHRRTNVVTAPMGAVDFVSFVHLGDIVTIDAVTAFCSQKSTEISVATASVLDVAEKEDRVVARALCAFVSSDEKGEAVLVPGSRLDGEEELARAFAGQRRYEEAKKARLAKKRG